MILENIRKFLSYWYFRYLLITELYMVELWERVMIYAVLLVFVVVLSFVNHYVVLKCVDLMFGDGAPWMRLSPMDFKIL